MQSIKLRAYQKKALLSIHEYFKRKNGNPIVAMPTGTGKSFVIAAMLKLIKHYGKKAIVLTHVKELIEQDYKATKLFAPELDCGIYSAGLGQRDTTNDFIFGGIASIRNKNIGHFDYILIDECHLVSDNKNTMYRKYIAMNTSAKVIGFSATPFRMKTGLLTDSGLFTDICYDITSLKEFNKLIEQGYLCDLIAKKPKEELDISQVSIRGGEYVPGELERAVNHRGITEKACDEIAATDRKHMLVFASGVDHCENVSEALNKRGIKASFVHSKISNDERNNRIEAFKKGKLQAIVNNNILTTGFDYPGIDLIGVLRPTMSPGLWVQMLGRGTRPNEGKTDCLVLDFAGNTRRLGPINNVILPYTTKRQGRGVKRRAPVKVCEHCKTYNHLSARHCVGCGAEFPKRTRIAPHSAGLDVVAKQETYTVPVSAVMYARHEGKKGTPSLRITYRSKLNYYREWICLEHSGFPRHKAVLWWQRRTLRDVPKTVEEALKNVDALKKPKALKIRRSGKYPEIVGFLFED